MSELLLSTNGLTKQYGHHKAVDKVNLHIKKGCYLWIYRTERCGKDDLPEDDQWTDSFSCGVSD